MSLDLQNVILVGVDAGGVPHVVRVDADGKVAVSGAAGGGGGGSIDLATVAGAAIALGQAAKAASLPVVLPSNIDPLPVTAAGMDGATRRSVLVDAAGRQLVANYGLDRNAVARSILLDAAGRQKISHAQPDYISADLVNVGEAFVLDMDSLSDAMLFAKGAAHAGYNLTWEYSPTSLLPAGMASAAAVAADLETWYPILALNVGGNGALAASTSGVLTANSSTSYSLSAPAASKLRARVTARTSGTLTVGGVATTAARPSHLSAWVAGSLSVSTLGTVTPGTGASNLAKAEDAPHATGDAGVFMLSVRQENPSSVTPASAAQDYQQLTTDQHGVLWMREKGAATAGTPLAFALAAATNTQLLAANVARRGAKIINKSGQTVYIRYGATAASASLYTEELVTGAQLEIPFQITAAIQAISVLAGSAVAAGTGLFVTEFTD